MGPVGDHLVEVHVCLGSRASLPDHQQELVVELPLQDLIARLHNQILFLIRKNTQFGIHNRGSFFQDGHPSDHLFGHRSGLSDFEVS